MNKHLTIKNFGPIKSVDLDILDYNVFIGPQATGKSTVAKAVYFFMSLKAEILQYIRERGDETLNLPDFERKIRARFLGFWGNARVEPQFEMKFLYQPDVSIELGCRDGYVGVSYSSKMEKEMSDIFAMANQNNLSLNKKSTEVLEFFGWESVIYIPAGRSILSTLPDSRQQQILGIASVKSDSILLDWPLRDFLDRINLLKPDFYKPLAGIIEDKQAFAPVSFVLDTKSLDIAQRLISLILKGKYRYDKSAEAIDVDDHTSVKLSFASSGQQESLWILMQFFSLILDRTKAFVIIEEPEAHLFPEAQKYMTDLMSLIANINGNQIMITTHSPYILTSLNNHIYAEQVGSRCKDKVSQIVDPSLWMNFQRVNAYYVEAGTIRSIMDEELHLIRAEEIDGASQLINREFSNLADVE